MFRACPRHGFSELTQIDTFYNGLNEQDQDSLNATASGNLLSKTTREALKIIENRSKVRYSRCKSNVSRVNKNSRESSSKTDDRIDKLADQISNIVEIVNKQVITPATVKAVEKSCVICRGAHAYYDCIATDSNQSSVCTATGTYNQVSPPNRASNQMAPPGFALGEMKAVTTRSGLAFEGPSIPTNSSPKKVVEREIEETTDKEQTNCQGSTAHIQPLVVPNPISEPVLLKTKPKPNIPYPSRLNDQRLREKATTDRSITCPRGVVEDVFVKVGKFHFPTDFVVVDFEADPQVLLILGRSFLRTGRALIDVYREEITLWVNDESVTFNLNQTMRYSSIYDDNSVNRVDFIDIAYPQHQEKTTFTCPYGTFAYRRIPFGLCNAPGMFQRCMIAIFHDMIEETMEVFMDDFSVFGDSFSSCLSNLDKMLKSNPTLVSNPSLSKETKSEFYKESIVKSSSPILTLFGESDFLLEEIEDFLKDESIPMGIKDSCYDPEGDIFYLEKLLNDDPSQLPPMDLKQAEETKAKSSIEEPPELELKVLPSHLEYAFLEENDKLLVIIAKDLKDDEKEALLKVLKSHKWAIA
nr:reverse transcriptase domain-containing protein [Tanacetum cinerariifolium]